MSRSTVKMIKMIHVMFISRLLLVCSFSLLESLLSVYQYISLSVWWQVNQLYAHKIIVGVVVLYVCQYQYRSVHDG